MRLLCICGSFFLTAAATTLVGSDGVRVMVLRPPNPIAVCIIKSHHQVISFRWFNYLTFRLFIEITVAALKEDISIPIITKMKVQRHRVIRPTNLFFILKRLVGLVETVGYNETHYFVSDPSYSYSEMTCSSMMSNQFFNTEVIVTINWDKLKGIVTIGVGVCICLVFVSQASTLFEYR